ncbi:MAG: co-chaperone GroES [Candidatus Onthovivens sp.]|nr:co-chaperone GroES [Candidatus Onthovivens sp.]
MIKPLNGNVLIKKEIKENKTKSGIVLSSKEQEEEFAKVLAISDVFDNEGKKIDTGIKVGDKVIYKNYSPTKITYEDEDYYLISYKEILGIIE